MSHDTEESENSPESPHLGEIKHTCKQYVPGASPWFLRAPGWRLIWKSLEAVLLKLHEWAL